MQDKVKVMVVNAIATDRYNKQRLDFLTQVINPNTQLDMVSIKHGYESLEYMNQELVNVVDTVRCVKDAEKAGYDSVLINCFFDPGLDEARELVRIPVIGAGEASLFHTSRLGHKFAVLATSRKSIPIIERHIDAYHLDKKCAGVISLGIGVPRLQQEGLSEEIKSIVLKQIDKAIELGAECLTVGCTASLGIGKQLSDISPIPVVDPCIISVKTAEMMGSVYQLTGLSHSKYNAYSYQDELELK